MSKRTAVIHIGLPKTGTTSLQAYLRDNAATLREQGVDVYKGELRHGANHIALHLSVLREGVETFGTIGYPQLDRTSLRAETKASIRRFCERSRGERLIFTNETLSFLRTIDECKDLRSLFPADLEFKIILVLRDKKSWLSSYTQQIYKQPNRFPSTDPKSALYVNADTWLTDYDQILRVYSAVFGPVTTLDYQRDDAVGPVLKAMGIRREHDHLAYRLNVRSKSRFWHLWSKPIFFKSWRVN